MCCMGLICMAVMAVIEKRRELCLWILLTVCLVVMFST